MKISRRNISALALSAVALIGLVMSEGYSDKAIIPIPGDVPTIGFGSTQGVKMGDTTTPQKALGRALRDVQMFEGAVKKCVTAPLYQHEYDAFISLSYNIGSTAFCTSTLVKKVNSLDYEGGCREILRWDRAGGRQIPGLAKRRKAEYQQCMGGQDANMGH